MHARVSGMSTCDSQSTNCFMLDPSARNYCALVVHNGELLKILIALTRDSVNV